MDGRHYKIVFEGETFIVPDHALDGYKGCEVVDVIDHLPEDNVFAMVSPEHLSSVHLQKAIEAVLILSGYDLPCSLLADEARETGADLQVLAASVHEKRRAQRDFEVARRKAKTEERKQGQ